MNNKSKNTSVLGIAQFLVVAGGQAINMFDGDPATLVSWALLVPSFILMISGFKQKDSGVTGTD